MDQTKPITPQEFWQENRAYFGGGMLRIVYSTPSFIVCNLCASTYVTFDLVRLPAGESRHGMRTTLNQFKAMVEDEGYYLRWLDHLYQTGGWRKRLVNLDEKTLAWMRELKAVTDAKGPTPFVDPAFEDQLFRRNIDAQKG